MLGITYQLGIHDMQQAPRKAEPGDYKHAVNANNCDVNIQSA